MNIYTIIQSQYYASLEMLKQAIIKCPDATWTDNSYQNQTWLIAYHVLFYTHLYLQHTEESFTPWEKGRKEIQFMGTVPWPPHYKPEFGAPYTKEEILEYVALVQNQVAEIVPTIDLEADSGFNWIPLNKMELQFYNIRHVMQHTGELCERLGAHGEVAVEWVFRKPDYLP
ncbi:MAG: hypothetical protein GY943_26390 [Chloroflexi bacterium]|nr:hypothetical protein [Chloroflexota bacterium]